MDDYWARNLSRMKQVAKQREKRLRDNMEQFRSQQEQTFATLDTRNNAMIKRRTQAIMDRFDNLLETRSGSRNKRQYSKDANWEPRLNSNEPLNRRRIKGSPRGMGNPSNNTTGTHMQRIQATAREETQLVACHRRTIDPRGMPRPVEELVPHGGITRTR